MKRMIAALLAVLMLLGMMTGCSVAEKVGELVNAKGYNGTDYKGTVTLADESYRNLSVDLSDTDYSVSDEDIDYQIDFLLDLLAETKEIEEDRPVQDGDTVNIDFAGTVDGVAFDGGTAEGYELMIGSNFFIDGFEEQLIGANVGDKLQVTATFPEDYSETMGESAKDLNGKEAVFDVTVNGIYESVRPELTDELMQEMGYDGIDDAKAEIRTYLETDMESQKETDVKNALWDCIEEIATVEINDEDVQAYVANVRKEYEEYAESQSQTLETFLTEQLQMTLDEFLAALEEMAEQEIHYYMIVHELAKQLDIKLNQQDYETGYAELLEETGYESDEAFAESNDGMTFEEYYSRESIIDALLADKVMEYIIANATIQY